MALALCLTLLPTAALAEEPEGTAQTSPAVEEAADPANGKAKQENQPAAPEQEGQSTEQEEQQEDSATKQDEAVAAVQAMIDALPDAAELDGMDDADAMAVYEAFQTACDAYYDTLTEGQQAQLKNTEKLAALSERFSQPATLATGTHAAQHRVCGKSGCTETSHDQITFDKWLASTASTGHTLVVGGKGSSSETYGDSQTLKNGKYVLNGGNYYLKTGVDGFEANVKVEHPIQITGNVTICLNGQTIESKAKDQPVFEVVSGGTLTLTDCQNNKGKVTHFSNGTGCGVYVSGGEFHMYGGSISGNTENTYGGGVYVYGGNSKFNMYGGTISGNNATKGGGGVYVSAGATFTMNGNASVTGNNATGSAGTSGGVYVVDGTFTMNDNATISDNTAELTDGGVGVYSGTSTTATFTMNGGEITRNKASSQGGGVGVYRAAKFEMNGGTISGNEVKGNGGGVYVSVSGKSTFTMNYSASVKDNTATNNGGGVYVESGTFNMNDGTISGNKAKNEKASNDTYGGGVYVNTSGTFEMNGNASVKDNTADTYGGGVCVKGGTFNMNDGEISGNTAPNGGGGVYASSGQFNMNRGTFNMNDGTISGNKANANGGGVFVHNDATFTVSLTPTVTGNKDTTNNADSNVYLMGSAYITIGGTLNEGASIGVTKITGVDSVIATGSRDLTQEDAAKFKSDDNTYEVKHKGKQLVLATKSGGTHTHEWTFTKETGNDSKIFVFCKGTPGSCDYKTTPATVKISTAQTVYDCAQITEAPKATLTHSANWPKDVVQAQENDIKYWRSNDGGNSYTVRVTDNSELKKPGKYLAQLEFNGKYLEAHFSVVDTSKQDPTYTAPTAKKDLVYTGTELALINEGSTTGGVMQYRLGQTGDYSINIPTATNADTYTVWYKVVGDASFNDVPEQSIMVTIEKAKLSGTPTFAKVTGAGKALKDVTFTKADGWPDGEFKWGNGVLDVDETAPLVQGKAYSWLYIAKNHYASGTVVPWPADSGNSSGGGGGSSSGSSDSNPVIKTETKNHADGSTTKTETRKDGSVTATTTGKDGSVSKTETKKDGSSVTENKAADGSTGTVNTDKNGQTEAKTALSSKAIEDAKKSGEAVKAPVEVEASRNSDTAPTVKIELPRNSGDTKVEIPVTNVKPGTVAVLVHPDGTEEIVKNSLPTENGIQLTVDGNATVKIVDNAKGFIDTQDHWAKDAIDFVSARGLVSGMSATIYAPNNSTTRAQMWTILARQNDADLTGGSVWYEKAQNWAKDKGVSDGTNPNAAINRAQMVTMLWRSVGQPAAAGSAANFTDVPTDSYYAQAVAWAVENDITAGVGGGRFDPNGTCTRAQIAAFLARSMK